MNNPSTRFFLPMLIGACLLLMLSFGYRAGFGLFLAPISEARGWGRDVFALALAVQNLAWGLCAVLAGGLADRYGNVRVILTGILLYGLGMWSMAQATTELAIVSTAGLLVGAGIAGTSFGIVLPAIAKSVPPEKRGWAMGLGTAAGSFGQFLVVPVVQLLVDAVGWYAALQFLGFSAVLMALCVVPIAANAVTPQQQEEFAGNFRHIAAQAFGVRSYVLLVAGFFVCGFHLAFITVHMPGYVVDLGFDASIGAWSISLIGLCNVFGSFYAGVLSGRHSMRLILSAIYLSRAIVFTLFFITPPSVTSILLFSAAMGVLWLATVPATSGLVALFFGTRYMSFLYGIVFLSHQVGSFTGVWLGGYLYERYGNYDGVWLLGIALGLAAAALHWPIREVDYSERLAPARAA